MFKTGIIRRIDDLGRIVIPRDVRRRLGLIEGAALEICIDQGKVFLQKYDPTEDVNGHISSLKDVLNDAKGYTLPNDCVESLLTMLQDFEQTLQEGIQKQRKLV